MIKRIIFITLTFLNICNASEQIYFEQKRTKEANSLLLEGAKENDIDKVNLALEYGANIDYKDSVGGTPLMWACYKEHLEIAKLLIEKKADINTKTNKGSIALHFACNNWNLKIVKLLLENGADINTKTENGCTALINACYDGNLEIVKLLVENGADINAKANNGCTALINACLNENLEIVKLLLENGADITFNINIYKDKQDIFQILNEYKKFSKNGKNLCKEYAEDSKNKFPKLKESLSKNGLKLDEYILDDCVNIALEYLEFEDWYSLTYYQKPSSCIIS